MKQFVKGPLILTGLMVMFISGCDYSSVSSVKSGGNSSEKSLDELMENPKFQKKLVKVLGWEEALKEKNSLTLEQAQKKWGVKKLSNDVFKGGPSRERAQMAVEIVINKKFLHQKKETLEGLLGLHDGFFFADRVPAYILEEVNGDSDTVWQLVFLTDWKGVITDYRFLEN